MHVNSSPPSRYATTEEALSDPFMQINHQINRINRELDLGDFFQENRARYPWALCLEQPEPYASRLWEYPWAIIEAGLEPDMTCADVGCGQTPFTIYLKEVARCEVIGFDPYVGESSGPYWGVSDEFIKQTGIQFVKSDVQNINWPDNSFDRVFCISVLEHIQNLSAQIRGIKEIARILKPGGLALISVDINLKQRMTEPLTLVWESGLSIYGAIDLTMPLRRFGIFAGGQQPADVFGFVLHKPDTKVQIDYNDPSSAIEAWKVRELCNTFMASYHLGTIDGGLEQIRKDLIRNNNGKITYMALLRIATKLLLRRYSGIRR